MTMILSISASIVKAQEITGLSVMTKVSFENNNISSPTPTPTPSSVTDYPIENKTVSYFDNSTGFLVYPSLNQSTKTEK